MYLLFRGTLPPHLLLETWSTIYDFLFPLASFRDRRTHRLMDQMIRKYGFDSEATWVNSVRSPTANLAYKHWGERLKILHKFVKEPPPENAFMAWFDRHTTERNALTVAIIGLFLAVLFGILGFIVGLIQLVIAWLAWKHPVSP